MPSPQSAYDLITGALRITGAIASGETPTADEATDALRSLNDILEDWSTEALTVYGQANETFNTVAGQATYTIGPGGNWATDRPVRINGGYCRYQGVDFGLIVVGQGEYDLIPLKTQQQPIVQELLYINENPLGLITLWPVPSQIVPITLDTDRVLDAVPTTATSMILPPGYAKALRWALAIELSPEYGRPVSPTMLQIATDAKADIKRANKKMAVANLSDIPADVGNYVTWQRGY